MRAILETPPKKESEWEYLKRCKQEFGHFRI